MSSLLDALTADHIAALAPDPGSLQAARKLARPASWPTLARAGDVLWGECLGSGAHPYLVGIDARHAEVVSKCSCPSRKFPCKHALGLLLLHAGRSEDWAASALPAALQRWLEGRDGRAAKAAGVGEEEARPVPAADPTPAQLPTPGQRRSQLTRERARTEGLKALEVWLQDLVREGLHAARSRPYSDWDGQARRLVDAKLTGAARLVRRLPTALHGEDGEAAAAALLGQLWLLTQGWRSRGLLSAEEQADLNTALGTPLDRSALPPAQPARWQLLGSVREQEDAFTLRRAWLLGEGGEVALLLDYAPAGQALSALPPEGQPFRAAVAFAPSAWPQRASFQGEVADDDGPPLVGPVHTVAELHRHFAVALAHYPWLERVGAALGPAYLTPDGAQVCDLQGHGVPLRPDLTPEELWSLRVRTGGGVGHFFGEWDGQAFWPLSAGPA